MKRTILMMAVLGLVAVQADRIWAHCEVPCGIYADQRRFEQMLEDQTTIAKAATSIQDLAGDHDPQSLNQLVRWINTKEQHATTVQHTIAQYFMTQRIQPGAEGSAKKLAAAHAVMVAAMKSKQSADPAVANDLRAKILDFYRAYEGKEPNLEG